MVNILINASGEYTETRLFAGVDSPSLAGSIPATSTKVSAVYEISLRIDLFQFLSFTIFHTSGWGKQIYLFLFPYFYRRGNLPFDLPDMPPLLMSLSLSVDLYLEELHSS